MGLTFFADWAWTGERFEADVVLDVEDGVLTRVVAGGTRPTGAVQLEGATLPGLANAHSHAFHRALRGRTHAGAGDFWAWRERMYAVAARLDPQSYERLATACFAEMAMAGITVVGEFHYLHHGPGGAAYDDANAMGEAVRSAARATGIRLTLLDTLYLRGGFAGEPLDPVQERFSDGDSERWAARVDALQRDWGGDDRTRVGVAVHSVRAVDPASMKAAAALSSSGRLPLHVHLSEQPAENDACQDAHGCSPTELLAANGVLGPFATAVHATHVSAADLDLLAAEGCAVCLCPTTERDLADGVGPAWAMAEQGIPLALGSDSHAVIDLFEEARAVELDERLVHRERGGVAPEALLAAATEDGAEALGWPEAGRLAVGRLADLTTVGLESVRLAGAAGDPASLPAAIVFCATATDVSDVVVGGQLVVREGRHLLVDDVPAALRRSIGAPAGSGP
ncbi:MAG: formimidoylglutamate deiminase [Acidimicrobiales bacterium]